MNKYLDIFIFCFMFFVSCTGNKDVSPSKQESKDVLKPKWTIGMSQCNLGEPWRVQMNQDIKIAAEKHPEIKVIFKDAQNDSLKQRAQIEEFINAEVDLLIVSPKEAAPMTPPISAAYDQGIPVIILDRRILGDKYTCFIGADNKKIGKAAFTLIMTLELMELIWQLRQLDARKTSFL